MSQVLFDEVSHVPPPATPTPPAVAGGEFSQRSAVCLALFFCTASHRLQLALTSCELLWFFVARRGVERLLLLGNGSLRGRSRGR